MRRDGFVDVHTHNTSNKGFFVFDYPFRELDSVLPFKNCSLSFHPKRLESMTFSSVSDAFFHQAFNDCIWAIGEVGMDKAVEVDKAFQFDVFVLLAQMAEQVGKPLIVHCVGMFQELERAYSMVKPRQAWIVHGFRGKPELAAQLLRLPRVYLSFGFRYNEETLRYVPLERLLIETDEYPAIEDVYAKIAHDRALDVEELLERVKTTLLSLQI